MSVKIIATACGEPTPVIQFGQTRNGDFTIAAGSTTQKAGDGVNDTTTWTFDFSEDPNWDKFDQSSEELSAALLTLVLKTSDQSVFTDEIQVLGLNNVQDMPPLYTGKIRRLPISSMCKAEIDLLQDGWSKEGGGTKPIERIHGGYSPRPLRDRMHNKQLKMRYGDDATVVLAILELIRG